MSAYRHGVTTEDILHAWRNPIAFGSSDDGFTMLIGPSRSGGMLEIGIVEKAFETRIVHAMSARRRYLR